MNVSMSGANPRVALVFPLYYASQSLSRVADYVSMNGDAELVDVFIFCSNSALSDEAKRLCAHYEFNFIERSNAGGGEGVFHLFQKHCSENSLDFRALVYLEESCEPLVKDWLWKLVCDLSDQSWISGWDWNFRGKRREFSSVEKLGSGLRKAWAYRSPSGEHPIGDSFSSEVWDTPGFRHEVLAIDFAQFLLVEIEDPASTSWREHPIGNYGRAMERLHWYGDGKKVHSSNVQFQLILKGSRIPFPYNKNLPLFRELFWKFDVRENVYRSTPRLRRNLAGINSPRISQFRSVVKYLFLHLGFDHALSRNKDSL